MIWFVVAKKLAGEVEMKRLILEKCSFHLLDALTLFIPNTVCSKYNLDFLSGCACHVYYNAQINVNFTTICTFELGFYFMTPSVGTM